ncbi:MAG: Na+/H+ antiporter NhaA [Bacteroidales bacterium]|nr:Na+/H+ antiporter NhaA [Bacteroidales bacterium]
MPIKKTKKILTAAMQPFQRFFQIEASGGIILLIATVVALVWANSPWGHSYHHLWESHLSLGIGHHFKLDKPLHFWINDGLMAIFFFVVGLEIKREILAGELSSVKKASLPIAAAIGGMVVPAVIYVVMNQNPDAVRGWGIPMATDIAFSLGILSLLGKRVPLSLKVFLVALAIVDDLGAVLVIAIFYSDNIAMNYLMIGLGLWLVLILLGLMQIRNYHLYMILGWVIWYMFYMSGVHPTIAGVLIAFSIPSNRKIVATEFIERIKNDLKQFGKDKSSNKITLSHRQLAAIDDMENEIERVQSPLQELEHRLHGFVTWIIMPIFALSNAGVVLEGMGFADIFAATSLNIEVALFIGKVAGITLFAYLAVKIGMADLPKNVKWVQILGLGFLGGIGFTMSLFVTNLAFTGDAGLTDGAKIGILVGSLLSGLAGYFLLKRTLPTDAENGQDEVPKFENID